MSAKSSFDLDDFNAKYGGVLLSKYTKDQIIFAQGSASGATFYIITGGVQLSVVSEVGKERVVGVLHAGDFCGEGCLSGELLRVSTATAQKGAVIARMEKPAVLRALHEDIHFSEFFVSYLLSRNTRLTDDLIDHLFNNSERRLARILLLLANFEKDDRQDLPIGHINQDTLAKMVGTTRGRINIFMNKFRRLGYIDYNGNIQVHPSLLNVVLRDGTSENGRH
jgi:CRP/FNR family transcriptional regulator, cyclic AMP receptor protein